jgi:hypothetical protein
MPTAMTPSSNLVRGATTRKNEPVARTGAKYGRVDISALSVQSGGRQAKVDEGIPLSLGLQVGLMQS